MAEAETKIRGEKPLRWNFRIIRSVGNRNFTFFSMLSETQTLKGKTSLIPNSDGKHVVMWDLEDCSLKEAEETLMKVQVSYSLSDIFIVSDKERSFRAWCFSQVDLKTLRKILSDTEYVDRNFDYYTVKRRKATLRDINCNKKGRPKQELVSTLHSYSVPIPEKYEDVIYDTGVEKRGLSILLGEGGKIILGEK